MQYYYHPEDELAPNGVSLEVADILKELRQSQRQQKPSLNDLRQTNRLCKYEPEKIDLPSVEDRLIHLKERQVPIRIYTPNFDRNNAMTFFIHGGSWSFCSINTHDNFCRQMCHQSQSVIVSIDYRLAPEYPFPAGLNDCVVALKWCRDHADLIGINPDYITISGDSAGANLATATCLYLKTDGYPLPRRQILFYPIVDVVNLNRPSHKLYGNGYNYHLLNLKKSLQQYLQNEDLKNHFLVSPFVSEDLNDMPRTTIILAECDIVRDEGYAYAKALSAAGNEVECHEFEGMVHAFMLMSAKVPQAKEALEIISQEINLDNDKFKQVTLS